MSTQKKRYYCIIHEDFVEGVLNIVPVYLHSRDRNAYVCRKCCKVHRTDGKATTFQQMEAQLEERLLLMPQLEAYIEKPLSFAECIEIKRSD